MAYKRSSKKIAEAKSKKKSAKSAKTTKRKKKKSSKKAHYVNAKDFYNQISEFYKTDILPDSLAEMINKIAIGLSYAPNFINYSYKDDMVGDAILKMFSALKNKKFNVDSPHNPFSYFTTIAYHAFINRIKKENKQHETIKRYQEAVYHDMMNDVGQSPIYTDPADVPPDD